MTEGPAAYRATRLPDLADRNEPASTAYLAADRTPEARAAYKKARAELPAAGMQSGGDLNVKTSTTWLPVQNHGEQLRSTRAK